MSGEKEGTRMRGAPPSAADKVRSRRKGAPESVGLASGALFFESGRASSFGDASAASDATTSWGALEHATEVRASSSAAMPQPTRITREYAKPDPHTRLAAHTVVRQPRA